MAPWANKNGSSPSVKQQAELLRVATLTVYQGKPRKNVCILSTVHTGVGSFSGAKAKPESVIYSNNMKYSMDELDQMERAYCVKGSTENGQWRSSITSLTWLGSMPASYSRSTSSRRA